jgi:hypothetical protein
MQAKVEDVLFLLFISNFVYMFREVATFVFLEISLSTRPPLAAK